MSNEDIEWDDEEIQWDDDSDGDLESPIPPPSTDPPKQIITPHQLAQQRLHESRIASRKRYFFYKRIDQLEQYALDLIKTKHGIPKAFVASMTGKFNVDGHVDLETLVASAPNSELDRTTRASAHINLRHPACSVQVNPGGHVSILGVTSCSDMYLAARRVARLIQISGACPSAKFTAFDINNVVLSTTLPFTFRLASVQAALVERDFDASFAEDIFPCIKVDGVYPHKNSVKIFHSGSFTIMGLKSLSTCIITLDMYFKVLKEINIQLQNQVQEVRTFGKYQTRILNEPTPEAITNQQLGKKYDIDGTPLAEEDDFILEHE